MGKTIHTLAYMITADTRSLTSGMTLTRKETQLTKAIMESSVTPAQKYADSLAAIQAVHAKGAKFDLSQAVNKLNEEFAVTAEIVPEQNSLLSQFSGHLAKINPLTVVLGASTAVWATGLGAVAAATAIVILNIKDQIGKIDDLIASASKLGVSAKTFQTWSHAAKLADLDIGKLSGGLESMFVAVSKGADGQKKLTQLFDILKLDAKELQSLRPEDQFQKIVTALSGIANVNDRLRVAKGIFGDAAFTQMADKLQHANQLVAQLGGGLSALDETTFGKFDDAVADMNLALDISWKKLTMQVVPALKDAADAATEWMISLNNNKTFIAGLDQIGAKLQIAIAIAREMPAAINSWLPSIESAKSGFESTNPKLGLLGRAVGMAVGAAGGNDVASDLSREQQRGAGLDEAFAAREAKKKKDLEDQNKLLTEQADAAKALQPAYEAASDAIAKMRAAGTDLVMTLKQQAETFGMTARQADIFKAAQMGASVASLVAAAALDQQLTEKERLKKENDEGIAAMKKAHDAEEAEIKKHKDALKSEAKSSLDSLMTPMELAKTEIMRFKEMQEAGLVDEDQFDKLKDKSIKKFRDSQKQEPFRNPAAMRGSQEAIAAIVNAKFGNQSATDKMVDLLEDIADNTGEDAVDLPIVTSFAGG